MLEHTLQDQTEKENTRVFRTFNPVPAQKREIQYPICNPAKK